VLNLPGYNQIGLITDFGNKGQHYISAMKLVIRKISKQVEILDVAHHVKPYSIIEGNFIICYALRDLPSHSILIAVIDPTVGTSRDIIAVKLADERILIGPNNGIFTLVSENFKIYKIFSVTNRTLFHQGSDNTSTISSTFHGRDIMAPVAAHISNGVRIDELGEELTIQDLVMIKEVKRSVMENEEIICTIIYTDEFGNLITNIGYELIPFSQTSAWKIKSPREVGIKHVKNFNEVLKDELGLILGSSGYFEICGKNQSASEILGIGTGALIKIIKINE